MKKKKNRKLIFFVQTKRRINLIPSINKIEKKFFHVKAPNDHIKHGMWINLSIDIHSFMEAWKGNFQKNIIKYYHCK